ncbi:MAG: HAMP domain-containing sensor histidine kinase [Cyanobacteriota bacterium]|nr:HAMP domain-containing sensor histidine kinase [Cyanobacteriota bacterium]
MKLNPIHPQNRFSREINDLFKENEQLRRENATLKEWLAIQGISSPLSSPVDSTNYDRPYNPSDSQINLISAQLSDTQNLNLLNQNQEQCLCKSEKIPVESELNHWQSSVASDFLQKRTLALEYLIHQQAQTTDNLNDTIQRITEIGTQTLETVQSIRVWLDLEKNPHFQNYSIEKQYNKYLCLPVSTQKSLEFTHRYIQSSSFHSLLDIPIQNFDGEIGFLRVERNNLSDSGSEEEQSFLECLANLVSIILEQEKLRNREKKFTEKINTSAQKLQQQTPTEYIDQITSSANFNLLTHISYELRTPIHSILGYSDLLCEEMLEQGQINWLQDIQTVRKQGYQLLQIVESISDLVRIESKQMSLNLELFDPVQVIQGVVQNLVPIAENNHNQLKIHYGRNLGLMYTDLGKLQKILHHLLENTLKFTERSQFQLTIRSQENWIDFNLTNTKIGNTTQQPQSLLEPFTQTSDLQNCKFCRTELKLTICRSLCEIMGGEMKVLGCGDRGLIFKVRLPAQLE